MLFKWEILILYENRSHIISAHINVVSCLKNQRLNALFNRILQTLYLKLDATDETTSVTYDSTSGVLKNANYIKVKGIVHPKMKILSSFTHPREVPNLYECVCSAEHKGRYSEECGKQSSSGALLTSIVFFFRLWKSMVPQNSEFGIARNSFYLTILKKKILLELWNKFK